jgi:exodeoxyribonuclease X
MLPVNVAVCDTETTGLDTKLCKVVEIALLNPSINLQYASLVDPEIPIPPEVSAVHHICDADVEGWATWSVVRDDFLRILTANDITILAAHNADYDKAVTGFTDVVWIDTFRCALRQWPDAPSHKNEVLKYWLRLGERGRAFNHGAHSALHDCKTTALILEELLKHQTLETLIEWSNGPKMFAKIPFGKHAGKKWEDIDGGYLVWMAKQTDMDKDFVECAKRELQRRRDNAASKPV